MIFKTSTCYFTLRGNMSASVFFLTPNSAKCCRLFKNKTSKSFKRFYHRSYQHGLSTTMIFRRTFYFSLAFKRF